jgi:hypothetical protein
LGSRLRKLGVKIFRIRHGFFLKKVNPKNLWLGSSRALLGFVSVGIECGFKNSSFTHFQAGEKLLE